MTWRTFLSITLTTLQLLIPAISINSHTPHSLDHALTALRAQRNASFRFIQIGAYIGATHKDPIFINALEQQWSGVLVEPVPAVYEQLRNNYNAAEKQLQDLSTSTGSPRSDIESRLSFENSAICDESKKTWLYYLSPSIVDEIISMLVPEGNDSTRSQMRDQLPNWSQQASSLLHSQMVNQLTKYFQLNSDQAEIIADKSRIEIQCMTYETLLNKHEQHLQQQMLINGTPEVQVDYVHIDAEGYDWNVVLAIISVKKKYPLPYILCYESMHIGNIKFRKEKEVWLFTQHDYICEVVNNGEDTCCYQTSMIGTILPTLVSNLHTHAQHQEEKDEM